jgi:hypothetical protein
MSKLTKFMQIAVVASAVALLAPAVSAHDGSDSDNSSARLGVQSFFNLGAFNNNDLNGDVKADVKASADVDKDNDQGADRDENGDNDSQHPRRALTGTVTAVGSASFDFKAANGTVYTVTVANATLRHPFSDAAILLTDIKVGDMVVVKGSVNGSDIAASAVLDMPANTHPAIIPNGTVTAVSGNTLTVQMEHLGVVSNVTVNTDANTMDTKSDGTAGTVSDVHVGSNISVKGLWNTLLNVLNAIKIMIHA